MLSSLEAFIKNKIEAIGTPLKDWEISIYRGILTGYNEAFIIDQKTRDRLIEASPKNGEIIRPILRGRDIFKYTVEPHPSWLINTHNGIKELNINKINVREDYPLIYNYLLRYQDALEKRYDQGDDWTNLRNCAYLETFECEKIVWLTISDKSKFAIDTNGAYCLDTAFFLTGEKLYTILSVLNSRIIEWYFDKICPSTGAGTNQWKKFIVETIPIPKVTSHLESQFKEIIIEIIALKLNDKPTSHLEEQLNRMVLELYNIDYEDVKTWIN